MVFKVGQTYQYTSKLGYKPGVIRITEELPRDRFRFEIVSGLEDRAIHFIDASFSLLSAFAESLSEIEGQIKYDLSFDELFSK